MQYLKLRTRSDAMYGARAKRANVLPARKPDPLPYPKMADYKGWEE